MGEGHSAKVVLDGDASGLNRAAQQGRDAMGRFTAALDKSRAAQAQQSRSIDGAIASMDRASTSIGKVTTLLGGAGLVGVAVQAAGALDAVSARALALSDVKNNLRINIDKARASTKGLVDDFTLQKTAMAGLRYGVFQSAEQMAKHVEIATTLARTLGTDSNKAVEDFTLGIARQSRLILDNLGILVSVEKANQNYARSIGVTVSQLTDEQKQLAFRNEAYAQAEKAIKGLKLEEDSWAASLQKTKVALTNLLDDLIELPKNIAELGDELQRSIGISDEAAESYATIARVGLAALTLGGSEAVIQLRELHEVLTETSAILGDRKGHGLFGSVQDVGTKMAQAQISAAGPGIDVTAGLVSSAAVGTAALAKWKREHRPKGGRREAPLSSEMIAAINASRAGGAFDRGSADTRDIAAAESAANGPGQISRAGADTRDLQVAEQQLTMTQRRIELDQQAEEQRQNFFGITQTDQAAELQRIEDLRAANVAYYSELRDSTTDTGTQLEAYEGIRQANHEAEMARIASEKQAEAERTATVLKAIDTGKQAATQTTLGILSVTDARRAATLAAKAQGKSDVDAAKAGKIAALEAAAGQLQSLRNLAITKAISETAEGLGMLATTWGIPNPAAMLHFAAAATWTAVGIGAGLGARGLQGRASSMQASMGGAGGGAAGGGSGSSGRGLGGGRSGSMPRGSDSPIPGSPGPSAPSAGGGSSGGAGNKTIVFTGPVHLYGTPHREFIRTIDEGLEDLSHNRRRRSA